MDTKLYSALSKLVSHCDAYNAWLDMCAVADKHINDKSNGIWYKSSALTLAGMAQKFLDTQAITTGINDVPTISGAVVALIQCYLNLVKAEKALKDAELKGETK